MSFIIRRTSMASAASNNRVGRNRTRNASEEMWKLASTVRKSVATIAFRRMASRADRRPRSAARQGQQHRIRQLQPLRQTRQQEVSASSPVMPKTMKPILTMRGQLARQGRNVCPSATGLGPPPIGHRAAASYPYSTPPWSSLHRRHPSRRAADRRDRRRFARRRGRKGRACRQGAEQSSARHAASAASAWSQSLAAVVGQHTVPGLRLQFSEVRTAGKGVITQRR